MSEDRKLNPGDHYGSPAEVLADGTLSQDGKIEVLTNWANDIRLLQVAEEENMPGAAGDLAARLAEVEQALLSLGHDDTAHDAKA